MYRILSFLKKIDNRSIYEFLPPIPLSGWLIFCCGNLILQQKKKKLKWQKQNFFDENQQKISNRCTYTYSSILYSGLAPSIRNVNMLQTLTAWRESTINHKIFETNSRFHAQYGKNPISVFQKIFSSINKIFISGGGLSTRQKCHEDLRFSWVVLKSLGNSYISLLLLVMLCIPCGERKICSIIKSLKILWTWL